MTFQEIINEYKALLKQGYLDGEIYKWTLIQKYKGRPNLEKDDLLAELKSIEYGNLIFHTAFTVRNELVVYNKEAYRNLLKELFDDNIELQNRIENFRLGVNKLYREYLPDNKLPDHHDERTIATILAFYKPEKYLLYKSSFYGKLVKALGRTKAKAGKRYVDYLNVANEFIRDYLSKDLELINLVKSKLPNDSYEDNTLTLLAQDIFYQVMDLKDKNSNFKYVVEEVKYLMEEDEVLKTFQITNESYNGTNRFVWIGDSHNIIGSESAHYEFQNEEKDGVYVDIHFEDKKDKNQLFFDLIQTLPKNVIWIDWIKKSKGLRFNKKFLLNDNETPENLKNTLLYLETNLGNQIRNILTENSLTPKVKINKNNTMQHPLNQIFYGSPGTGKTYNTINTALEIIDEKEEQELDFNDRIAVKELFNKRVQEGKIVFTTFHQSMTYEDFIEGIKPETVDGNVVYEVTDGIFKTVCEKAKAINVSNFDEAYSSLLVEIQNSDNGILELKTPTNKSFWVSINSKNNLSLITGINKIKIGRAHV